MAGRPNLLAGETLPPKPSQRRSVEKQLRIKAASLAEFNKRGYANASIGEIARQADLAVGGVYIYFRSKRQLLLVLMDELLEGLNRLSFSPNVGSDTKNGIRKLLWTACSHDLRYLGAYRAWKEAALSDPELARKQQAIQKWTTRRLALLFSQLQQIPEARPGVDIHGLALVMDTFFWSFLSDAAKLSKAQLGQRIDAAAHLIHHGLFCDD